MGKIIINLQLVYEVDGKVDLDKAQDAVLWQISQGGAILSEDVDGTEDWALLFEKCEVVNAEETD